MVTAAGVLLACIAGFLAFAPSSVKRLVEGDGSKGTRGTRGSGGREDGEAKRKRAVLGGVAGILVGLLVGGLTGVVVGGAAGWGCWWWTGRGESAEDRGRRARVVADLPMAVELLAACLAAGVSWAEAVEAVAGALGGPLGEDLERVSAQIRLGADPAEAWQRLSGSPETAPLARAAVRATRSGASLAPVLNRLARDQRRTAKAAAEARARSAAIQAVAPLGLCFLPAFFFLGIVPSIAGVAQNVTLP